MASLTCENLRMELRRLPLVTEATMRSAFREELGGILALLQQTLGTETCRSPIPPAPSNTSTHGDSAETNPNIASLATSTAQVQRHGLADARRSIGTGKGAGMVQDDAGVLDFFEKPSAKLYGDHMVRQISGQSFSSSGESTNLANNSDRRIHKPCQPLGNRLLTSHEHSDLQAASQSHPPAKGEPGIVLPGEVAFSRLDEQQETIIQSPNVDFTAELDQIVPGVRNSRILQSDNRHSGISTHTPLSSGRFASEKSLDSSTGRTSSKDSRIVGTHKVRVRTSEDTSVQTNSKFKVRRWAARIVCHWIFDYVVAALIALNGVLVGVQTDHLARELTDETPIVFQVLEIVFCVAFTIELCLRLCTYGSAFLTMSGRGWNLFDLVVVFAQILELSMEAIASGMGYSFNLLRVLRLFRVVRLARALRLVVELRTLVSSIAGSMKPFFWTAILLFLVVYVLGVYTTQVVLSRRISYRDANERAPADLELYWGDLGKSIMSLFQSITGGIDWDQVARPLAQHISSEMNIVFSMYIGFAVFCILNVVTGVFIESVISNEKTESELRVMNHVMQLFASFDVHETGEITWEAFHENLHRKEMQEFFKTIDVEIGNARTLFELLDVDSSGSVDIREFMDGCIHIWAPPRGLDLRMILRDVNKVLAIVLEDMKQRYQRHETVETCAGG